MVERETGKTELQTEGISELRPENKNVSLELFTLKKVPIDQLVLLKKNARYMPKPMFDQLVANIRKDGGLSSAIICSPCENDKEKYEVLSGNHRTMAASYAGITQVWAFVPTRPLSPQEKLAIQLSHNAISGQDNIQLLQELFGEIEDLDLKMYSGLTDDMFVDQASDIGRFYAEPIDYSYLLMAFLPEDLERIKKIIDDFPEVDYGLIASKGKEYDELIEAFTHIEASTTLKSASEKLLIILDIFSKHVQDLQDVVPIDLKKKHASIAEYLGYTIDLPTARKLIKVLDDLTSKAIITKEAPEKALGFLLDMYLEAQK